MNESWTTKTKLNFTKTEVLESGYLPQETFSVRIGSSFKPSEINAVTYTYAILSTWKIKDYKK